jgi:hypothetical protein
MKGATLSPETVASHNPPAADRLWTFLRIGAVAGGLTRFDGLQRGPGMSRRAPRHVRRPLDRHRRRFA